jgi:multidrug transporter EmrE-like cation transporter
MVGVFYCNKFLLYLLQMDITKILIGILFGILGQFGSFMQLQGAIKYNWHGKYMWIILLSSIPVSWLFIKSVRSLVEGFGGEIWPSRLIGFSIGMVVFTLLSIVLFKESFSLKTIVCLFLGLLILLIQLFWK